MYVQPFIELDEHDRLRYSVEDPGYVRYVDAANAFHMNPTEELKRVKDAALFDWVESHR